MGAAGVGAAEGVVVESVAVAVAVAVVGGAGGGSDIALADEGSILVG